MGRFVNLVLAHESICILPSMFQGKQSDRLVLNVLALAVKSLVLICRDAGEKMAIQRNGFQNQCFSDGSLNLYIHFVFTFPCICSQLSARPSHLSSVGV